MSLWSLQETERRRTIVTRLLKNMIDFVQGLDEKSGDPVMTRLDAIHVVRSYQEKALTKFEAVWGISAAEPWRALIGEILDAMSRQESN